MRRLILGNIHNGLPHATCILVRLDYNKMLLANLQSCKISLPVAWHMCKAAMSSLGHRSCLACRGLTQDKYTTVIRILLLQAWNILHSSLMRYLCSAGGAETGLISSKTQVLWGVNRHKAVYRQQMALRHDLSTMTTASCSYCSCSYLLSSVLLAGRVGIAKQVTPHPRSDT